MPAASAASSSLPVQTRFALLPHDDRGAGVLAHRQHPAGRDIGVLQEVVGDEAVVVGGLRVIEDRAQLGEMAGPEKMRDVEERLLGEEAERLRLDGQDVLAPKALHAHMAGRELAVRSRVVRKREQRVMGEFGHFILSLRGPAQ